MQDKVVFSSISIYEAFGWVMMVSVGISVSEFFGWMFWTSVLEISVSGVISGVLIEIAGISYQYSI